MARRQKWASKAVTLRGIARERGGRSLELPASQQLGQPRALLDEPDRLTRLIVPMTLRVVCEVEV